jgi:hypothetical protein
MWVVPMILGGLTPLLWVPDNFIVLWFIIFLGTTFSSKTSLSIYNDISSDTQFDTCHIRRFLPRAGHSRARYQREHGVVECTGRQK